MKREHIAGVERSLQALDKQPALGVAMGASVLHAVLYGVANRFPLRPPIELPFTAIDRAIPFVPASVWIYLSDYALVFFAFLACQRPGARGRFAGALFLVVATSVLLHWAFPVRFPRESFPVPEGGLSAGALSMLRMLDAPTSCLPSLHVAASYIAALAVRAERRPLGHLYWVWATAVAVSTLTLKQHYLADVMAGWALATGVFLLFYRSATGAMSRRAASAPRFST